MSTEVDSLFKSYVLNSDGLEKARLIAEDFDMLYRGLSSLLRTSREFCIVKTKLEEAAFYAKKAMAQEPENQLLREPAVSRFDYKDGGSLEVFDRPKL